jgi:hypothetical protein
VYDFENPYLGRERIMSNDARLMCGVALILIPTIVFGGLVILGILTNRSMGTAGPNNLSPAQVAFYRAGHAHAGVLTLLALFLQIAVDYAAISATLVWPLRIGAITAALLISGGFFGAAHHRALRVLLYLGATILVATTLMVGIGLLRSR